MANASRAPLRTPCAASSRSSGRCAVPLVAPFRRRLHQPSPGPRPGRLESRRLVHVSARHRALVHLVQGQVFIHPDGMKTPPRNTRTAAADLPANRSQAGRTRPSAAGSQARSVHSAQQRDGRHRGPASPAVLGRQYRRQPHQEHALCLPPPRADRQRPRYGNTGPVQRRDGLGPEDSPGCRTHREKATHQARAPRPLTMPRPSFCACRQAQ